MKHLYHSFISVLLLLLTLSASAYKQQSINITVNGKSRNMVCFTPNDLPAKSPLMIVTHGMNQDPEYQMGSDKLYEMIDTAKFVVTYLRSDGNTWDIGGTNDQTFVSKTIDEMAKRFDIDKERVYWSGFSMGSMLIHHCIANMQNKIAAFAPTSGIQFSEQPWTKCQKPVNLLECIAYDDGTFGYEEYGIHAYIENYAKHDKHTNYSKTVYQPGWYNGDLEKWTGGPNGGEVWLFSYNSGGHWPMTDNRSLIWNFCKRFSLNQPQARITVPTGETTNLYMGPKEEAVFPDVQIEATAKAKATGGSIVQADIYDGNTLLATLTEAPYTATLTAPGAGAHDLRVVATDNNGKTADAYCLVNNEVVELQANYDLCQNFTIDGAVPQDWYVSNGTGSSTRVGGGGMPYANGPRLLHFTNEQRGFDYGLLIQNSAGKEKAAWAKFGDEKGRSTLLLHAGHYILSYRIYNWNQPEFAPLTMAIERASDGQEVASKVYTPTVNIGGNTTKAFKGIKMQKFEFDIKQTGYYVVVFYTDATKDADFVVGRLTLKLTESRENDATGIVEINRETITNNRESKTDDGVYDLQGCRIKEYGTRNSELKKGLYIVNGKKVVIK
jgi:poly(3-hydroxybutyrate) depolymerase